MIRIIAAVALGFVSWLVVWLSIEKTLSSIWPDWYGSEKKAFEEVLKNGGNFVPTSKVLGLDIVFGALSCLIAGFVSAWIANESSRSPVFVAGLLLLVGVLKLVMSWKYVPLWYHVIFTGLLFPMTVLGGKLKGMW